MSHKEKPIIKNNKFIKLLRENAVDLLGYLYISVQTDSAEKLSQVDMDKLAQDRYNSMVSDDLYVNDISFSDSFPEVHWDLIKVIHLLGNDPSLTTIRFAKVSDFEENEDYHNLCPDNAIILINNKECQSLARLQSDMASWSPVAAKDPIVTVPLGLFAEVLLFDKSGYPYSEQDGQIENMIIEKGSICFTGDMPHYRQKFITDDIPMDICHDTGYAFVTETLDTQSVIDAAVFPITLKTAKDIFNELALEYGPDLPILEKSDISLPMADGRYFRIRDDLFDLANSLGIEQAIVNVGEGRLGGVSEGALVGALFMELQDLDWVTPDVMGNLVAEFKETINTQRSLSAFIEDQQQGMHPSL